MTRIEPHPAMTTIEQIQAPGRHDGSLNRSRPRMLPMASENMNRATRVPASTVVRMKSASNITAKWYQKDFSPSPPKTLMTSLMPKARVGAPPVRETIVSSPTLLAASCRVAESMGGTSPPPGISSGRPLTKSAAPSGVPPVAAAGAFIAK